MQGIYKITNSINNQVYVGKSTNIEERFKEHMRMLKNNKHHAYKLQDFYNKNYKRKGFKINFEILEAVANETYLDAREKYYIDLYDSYSNGFNSMGLNGCPTMTKKRELKNKKLTKINKDRNEYEYLINKHKDNLYLQYTGYNDTYLYRVNEAIKYFIRNYNTSLYKAEISQYKHDVDLSIIDKNFRVVQRYEYKTKHKAMGLNRYTFKKYKDDFSEWDYDRYKKFNNIHKSLRRYKWFLKRFCELDENIIKFNTVKYRNDQFAIKHKDVINIIGYESGRFKKHIAEDKEIQALSKELGISYPHGKVQLNLN